MLAALEIYRERFKPSEQLDRPYVMIGANVVAAPSDEEAEKLATTVRRMFLGVITGQRELLQPPSSGFPESWTAYRYLVSQMLACSLIGGAAKMEKELTELLELTRADEIIAVSHLYDHHARIESYRIFAEVCGKMGV
jgi:alkanesulfonate monooxygenase SsuD/methylene tetrahydromethanopterin reductase-like flavin-dependent oxidoreductase (luciferase family)